MDERIWRPTGWKGPLEVVFSPRKWAVGFGYAYWTEWTPRRHEVVVAIGPIMLCLTIRHHQPTDEEGSG